MWRPPQLPDVCPYDDVNNRDRSDYDGEEIVTDKMTEEVDDEEEEDEDRRGSDDLTFGPGVDELGDAWDQFAANHEGLIGFKRVIPFKEEFYTTALPRARGPRAKS